MSQLKGFRKTLCRRYRYEPSSLKSSCFTQVRITISTCTNLAYFNYNTNTRSYKTYVLHFRTTTSTMKLLCFNDYSLTCTSKLRCKTARTYLALAVRSSAVPSLKSQATRITIIHILVAENCWLKGTEMKTFPTVPLLKIICTTSMLDVVRIDGKTMKF